MQQYATKIEEIWPRRAQLLTNPEQLAEIKLILAQVILGLNQGSIRVCEKKAGHWLVNEWVKKAILLYFQVTNAQIYPGDHCNWYDKIPPKFTKDFSCEQFKENNYRIVPKRRIYSHFKARILLKMS